MGGESQDVAEPLAALMKENDEEEEEERLEGKDAEIENRDQDAEHSDQDDDGDGDGESLAPLRSLSDEDILEFAARRNLIIEGSCPWTVTRVDRARPLGRIHRIADSYKATCSHHTMPGTTCICYMSTPPGLDRAVMVVGDLIEWLGKSCELTREAHYAQSAHLRRDKYHMRIRNSGPEHFGQHLMECGFFGFTKHGQSARSRNQIASA